MMTRKQKNPNSIHSWEIPDAHIIDELKEEQSHVQDNTGLYMPDENVHDSSEPESSPDTSYVIVIDL